MGPYLGQWFVLTIVVSAAAAFLATKFVPMDPAHASRAGKLVAVVSFIGYGFGTLQESIWMMRPWAASAKYLLDSLLYAIGTGLVFWWLWR